MAEEENVIVCKTSHKWASKPDIRAGAFGWRGSRGPFFARSSSSTPFNAPCFEAYARARQLLDLLSATTVLSSPVCRHHGTSVG